MFDPYRKWLGIPPKDQPPNHYRLLGLELFESDLDVIEGAADRAMGFVRQYQSGEHAPLAAKVLNEIATARLCLLKPDAKADYDARLRKQTAGTATTTSDDAAFELDDQISQGTKLPGRVSKSKRKKAGTSQGLYVAAGIGAVVIVLFIALGRPSGNPPPTDKPADSNIVETKTMPQTPHDPVAVPTTASKSPDVATDPVSLIESKLVDEPVGPRVDLILSVDPAQNTYSGNWQKVGSSLTGEMANGAYGKLYLPTKVPDDYQIRVTVKRTRGNDGFGIGFIMDGRQGMASYDVKGTACGLNVDAQQPAANCTARHGAVFQNNQLSTVVLTVHPGHVHSTVDGKTVIDWYGERRRLWNQLPTREVPSFVTGDATYQVESAVLVPIKPEPKPKRIAKLVRPIEILPLLDSDRDSVAGIWAISKGILHSPATGSARLSLPVAVPQEYTFSAIAEFPADSQGEPYLIIGLVAGDSACSVVLRIDECVGLDVINGRRWNENETRNARTFPKGEPIAIACTVTKQTIRLEGNGRTLIDWKGDFRQLSATDHWAPSDDRKLFLGSTTHVKLRDLKLGPPAEPPTIKNQPQFRSGQPVDLLALVDPERDTLSGTVSKDGPVLRVSSPATITKVSVPCELPAEYKLTVKATRDPGGKSDDECFLLRLPIDGQIAHLTLDAFHSTASGLELDGLHPNDVKNPAAYRRAVLPANVPQQFSIFVHRTGLKVQHGDQTIIDWVGNPHRLTSVKDWESPRGRLTIGCWNSRFRVEQLEVEPLESTSFPPIARLNGDGDLLSIMEPIRDSTHGEWKREKDGLLCPAIAVARIRIPIPAPDRYVLTAIVERKTEDADLLVGLIVGGHPCLVALDGDRGKQEGLDQLDGQNFYSSENMTRRVYNPPLFPARTPVKLTFYVLPDTVIVNCGEKEVVRWHGDPRRFSVNPSYLPPNPSAEDRDHMWIGAWYSNFLFHKLELKPLTDSQATTIQAEFKEPYPIKPEPNEPFKPARSFAD